MPQIEMMTQAGLDKLKRELAEALAQRPQQLQKPARRETSLRMQNMTQPVTHRAFLK